MRKLRARVRPDGNHWTWTIDIERMAGGWMCFGLLEHDPKRFEGRSSSHAKAVKAARKGLHEAAGRLAVRQFDDMRMNAQGITVEI